MTDYRERLTRDLEANAVVTVVGTGVSVAMSRGAEVADWVGLLQSGIDCVNSLGIASEPWIALQRQNIDYAVANSDTTMLIGVAGQVHSKLCETSRQPFADWMRDTVGSLRPDDKTLGTALGSLLTPLLTTNYDSLLEDCLKRQTVTWADREGLREIFRSDSDAVGHLHGHWKELDSVVMTESDYARVLADDPAQALEMAHYASKSFLFVGYGAGLADPNFEHLLKWHRKLFPESRNDHYRLCRAGDLAALTAQHRDDDIRVISYGESHDDLPGFLASLRAPSQSGKRHLPGRDAVAYAREAIVDQIRAETVMGDSVEDIDDRELSDITVKPVLLPMPHEQFAQARSVGGELRPERINPDAIHRENKLLILAGDELSGVTTALRWIVANAALHRARTAPIFVDARLCTNSKHPLERQIKREANKHGLFANDAGDVVDFALAIDNVKPQGTEGYSNLVADIHECSAQFIIVGCREGDEGQVFEDLRDTTRTVEIAYLGKLSRPEVQEFARILAPARPSAVCDSVMRVVQTERLPRTPFTIALLVVLLSQSAGANFINNSETAVLEQYTNLLLGRSGPLIDPRQDLDPQNREVVLAELAKRFVRLRRGAVTEGEAIDYISEYFISRDWSESASSALENFRRMRLLRVESNTVQFQQTSYLHLFAAKAATRDSAFLSDMLKDPLYFAPIIRHYAALVRNSDQVVGEMTVLLEHWEPSPPEGKFYGPVRKRAIKDAGEDGEQLEASSDPKSEKNLAGEAEPENSDEFDGDDYDDSSDADRVPFPLDSPDSWPQPMRLGAALELASRVLRDSDDLSDLETKSKLFKLVIARWGYLAEIIERDGTFNELAAELTDAFVNADLLDPEARDRFAEFFGLGMTGFTLYRGLVSTLASRKLIRTFERVRDETDSQVDPYSAIMLTLFAMNVRPRGWTTDLNNLAKTDGDRWSTSRFVDMMARMLWESPNLLEQDVAEVREFLKRSYQNKHEFPNERTRKIRVKEFEQKLIKARADKMSELAKARERPVRAIGRA